MSLDFAVSDGIGRITLKRPERKNAFTLEMIDSWVSALKECRENDDVKVVVVTGAGSAFCAGGDIAEMAGNLGNPPAQRKDELTARVHRIPLALRDLDKPVIAAINGVAVGAGLDLALMCDLRYAASSAKFAETYINIGLVPGAGGAYFLPRLVGIPKALEMFLTGKFVDAQEAVRIGLVNAVYADEALASEVNKIAAQICNAPQLALRLIKRAVYQSTSSDLGTHLDLMSSHYAVITSTDEYKNAVRKFVGPK